MHKSYLTKKQVEKLLASLEVGEPCPHGNNSLWISFPNRTVFRITPTKLTGTYGGKLYDLEFFNDHNPIPLNLKRSLT